MKHTPGPWEWTTEVLANPNDHSVSYRSPDLKEIPWDGRSEDFRCLRPTQNHLDFIVAGAWRNDNDADVMVSSAANARLIAAAPELLATLKEMLDCRYMRDCEGCTRRVKEAIKLATGE